MHSLLKMIGMKAVLKTLAYSHAKVVETGGKHRPESPFIALYTSIMSVILSMFEGS